MTKISEETARGILQTMRHLDSAGMVGTFTTDELRAVRRLGQDAESVASRQMHKQDPEVLFRKLQAEGKVA